MERYFGIKYCFDKDVILKKIKKLAHEGRKGYICIADGVSLAMVYRSPLLKRVFDHAEFSVCDSGWVPIFLKWVHGIKRYQYAGCDLFSDIIKMKQYNMMFLGTSDVILKPLQIKLALQDPRIQKMHFNELPFCNVEDFNYELIGKQINSASPDIIWLSLGMPKQEVFMYNLLPYINKGILIGVGAAFKFHSGLKNKKRAPQWMIKLKLEWLYRIYSEPGKQIKRCILIVRTLPVIIYKESKLKKDKNAL